MIFSNRNRRAPMRNYALDLSCFSRLAPTRRAAARAAFFAPLTLKPQGIQSFRKSQAFQGAVPLSRSLSRSLSRWFVNVISGLGGLSRCPAHCLIHVHAQARARRSLRDSGTAGQHSLFLSFILLNQIDRRIKYCPVACPAAAGFAGQRAKANKIRGFYSYV